MQLIMEEVYRAETIRDFEAVLDGFKFESSAAFPGAVDPPSDPTVTHTVRIQGSFPDTFGRDTLGWTLPARKPTGCYLAPGTIATVTVPPALVGRGYLVRVGAHSWDLSGRNLVRRLERATILYALDQPSIRVASPYGGGIYLEVPMGADAGEVDIAITGAVRSPYFSMKSFHTTTNAEWIATERNHPAPWADFQTDKFMMQVPTSWIVAMDDPTTLMRDWDRAMDAMNDLMGFPHLRGKETMYRQVDVITRSSTLAPGYPAVNTTYISWNPSKDMGRRDHLLSGPQVGWHWDFHEQGHGYLFPKFGGETESNVNLPHVAVLHRAFGFSLDDAFRGSVSAAPSGIPIGSLLDQTAVLWMTAFDFSPRDAEMKTVDKSYRPQGHAKFVDVVRLFGWEGLDAFWYSVNLDEKTGNPLPGSDDAKLLRLCQTVGKDLRPLFHFWGIHPDDPATLAAAIEAEDITASAAVFRLLKHYQSLIPPDLDAFRNWCLDWYGRQPSLAANHLERDHARQWDTTDHSAANGEEPLRPDGEVYAASSALDIEERVQEIIDIYFGDYTLWAAAFESGDLDDPAADFDGDGWSNADERAFGLDPTDATSVNPISEPLGSDGRFLYTRRDNALTGLTYRIWTSTDLETWREDPLAIQTAGDPDPNGVQTVSVRLDESLANGERRFVRVVAE